MMQGRLTPQQVAEMAKAGVKIEFKDVVDHLDAYDRIPPHQRQVGSPEHLTTLLMDRLHRPSLNSGLVSPVSRAVGAFMVAVRVNDDVIVTFLVANNQPLMLEDDARLFPSDSLITKIRLLETK